MKRRVAKILDLPSSGHTAVLLILAISFALGVFAGCFLADCVSGEGDEELRNYFTGFLEYSGSLPNPNLIRVFWSTFRWHIITLCLGISAIGLIGIPVLFVLRGFLLAFSAASFYSVFGLEGLLFSFVILGITGIISIPVLFVLGVRGFLASGASAGRLLGTGGKRLLVDRSTVLCFCVCFAVLTICALIEYSVLPSIIVSLSDSFVL